MGNVVPMNGEAAEVVDMERKKRLDELAEEIRQFVEAGRASLLDAAERYFGVGRALYEARSLMQSNQEFGGWIREQGWPWSRQWLHVLRQVGEHEDEIREILIQQTTTAQREGLPLRPLNIKAALGEVMRTAPNPDQPLPDTGGRFSATATIWGEIETDDDDYAEEWRIESADWPSMSSATFTATPLYAADPGTETGAEFLGVLGAIEGIRSNDALVGRVSAVCVNAPEVDDEAGVGLRIHVDGVKLG